MSQRELDYKATLNKPLGPCLLTLFMTYWVFNNKFISILRDIKVLCLEIRALQFHLINQILSLVCCRNEKEHHAYLLVGRLMTMINRQNKRKLIQTGLILTIHLVAGVL